MRLGSGALGCRASVEDCGAVAVDRQDPIRVWELWGSGRMETLRDFPGGDGSCGW